MWHPGPAMLIVADGFSGREQIAQATNRRALHLAELIQLPLKQPLPGQYGGRGKTGADAMRYRRSGDRSRTPPDWREGIRAADRAAHSTRARFGKCERGRRCCLGAPGLLESAGRKYEEREF